VYLVGGPGVGKSALMDALTLGYDRALLGDQPRREQLYPTGAMDTPGWRTTTPVAVELGARVGRHPIGFPGTDAMSMSTIVSAEQWLLSGDAGEETPLILGEGARLGVRRFVNAVLDAGIRLDLVLVIAESAERRRTNRGSTQKPEWVKGAFTRATRIHDYVATMGYGEAKAHVLANDVDLQHGVKYLRELTGL
jgi:hypothetical protein